jgi:hypothetical protein
MCRTAQEVKKRLKPRSRSARRYATELRSAVMCASLIEVVHVLQVDVVF